MRWAVNDDGNRPLPVEVGADMPEELISSIASHSNLRMALLEGEAAAFSSFDILDADPLRPLPWLRLREVRRLFGANHHRHHRRGQRTCERELANVNQRRMRECADGIKRKITPQLEPNLRTDVIKNA